MANKEEYGVIKQLSEEETEILKERMENYQRYFDLYRHNEKFHEYVDKNCKAYNIRKDFCLLLKIVQEVGEYYISMDKNPNQQCISPDIIFEQEDKAC